MENEAKILPFATVSGHIHQSWFEVYKDEEGVEIMCPEGCRRRLNKWGQVLDWDKDKSLWVKR